MSVSSDCSERKPDREDSLMRGESSMTFQDRLYPPHGLRVLVTAGASGIGAAIASAFTETDAEVHVCDIDDAALTAFQKRFPSCVATHADVADEGDVAAMFKAQR